MSEASRRVEPGPGPPDGVRLGPLWLPGRVVFTAHLTNFAEDGLPTDRHAAYYAARAAGGAGLVITEEQCVHPSDGAYPKTIRGYRPEALPGYRGITDAVHAYGVPVLAQLNHNGGQSCGRYTRRPVWAPSPVPDPLFREVPKAMSHAEIAELVAGYAEVAARCAEGGFDGVEVQASQSSVLLGFLSTVTNLRTDHYGGPHVERRSRLLLEVVAAVRAALGPGKVLGVRLGPDGMSPGTGGVTLDDVLAVGRLLAATGQVDYLSTTIGLATTTQRLITPPMGVPAGYALPVARALRAAVAPLPVIGVGRFTTREDVDRALVDGDCDLVGVARGQIADPAFAGGSTGQRCVGCNQECVGRVGLNRALGCLVNPRAGRERVPTRVRFARRVLVVGGGPGGLRAAATAAERGHRVTLVERTDTLGGQVELAARSPGRGELAHLVADLVARCRSLGVEVRAGSPATADSIVEHRPDALVLATGARPTLPAWAAGLDRVVHARDVLAGVTAPAGRILVLDEVGGHAAPSVAELLAAVPGNRVEIVTPMLAVGQDLGLTLESARFEARAVALGIAATPELVVLAAERGAGALRVRLLRHLTGVAEERVVDWLVCAVPQRPADELWHELKDGSLPVWRVGDCLAPRRAAAAILDGQRVGELL